MNSNFLLCTADDVENGCSSTTGIIPMIREPSSEFHQKLCNDINHYGSIPETRGLCGYRNIQMLLSSLVQEPTYKRRLFNGNNNIPSVARIQELIEEAWRRGIDPNSQVELRGRPRNTRQWIGPSEAVAILTLFRVRCRIIHFYAPTGPDNTHPLLFQWMYDYFSKTEEFKIPIYLQFQGHCKMIIGVERCRDESIQILALDPGWSKSDIQKLFSPLERAKMMRKIRYPMEKLRKYQYQIIVINGFMDTDDEFEGSKKLLHEFIPSS